MARKKPDAKDDYDQDDSDLEEQAHRKGGLRRHRGNRRNQMDPLEKMNEAPQMRSGKKGDTKDG